MPLSRFDDPLPLPSSDEVLSAWTPISLRHWRRHWVGGMPYPFAQTYERDGLSRGDVFSDFQQGDWARGVISTLMWGYPKGTIGPGRATGLTTALQSSRAFAEALRSCSEGPPLPAASLLARLNRIADGIGPSTTSKFAYFAGIQTLEGHALIYDQMVRRAVRGLPDPEMQELREAIRAPGGQRDISPQKASQTYGLYLSTLTRMAAHRSAEPAQIEYQLFRFGRIAHLI